MIRILVVMGLTAALCGSAFAQNSLDFDGHDDYMQVPHSSDFVFTDGLTVEMWVQVDAYDGSEFIISKRQLGNAKSTFEFWTETSGSFQFCMFSNGTGSANCIPVSVSTGTWTHLAGTVEVMGGTQTMRLYKDGAFASSTSFAASGAALGAFTSTSPLWVGTQNSGSPAGAWRLDGQVDDLKIWNVARTEAQIQQDMVTPYNANTAPDCLVAYYDFDDANPGLDRTGGGNNGSLVGTAGANNLPQVSAAQAPALGARADAPGVCAPTICDTGGDVNGDGSVDVNDVQCTIMAILADFNSDPAPACLEAAYLAESDCDESYDVDDVKVSILYSLGGGLPSVIDADDNLCPDACE